MIPRENTIWLNKKHVLFRLLAVLPDDDDVFKPIENQRLTCYASQCYAKEDDGSSGAGFDSVALPVSEFLKEYFPVSVK